MTGRKRDGTVFPLHLSVGMMSERGEPKFTGILHDLSQRVAIEAQLREQTALARSAAWLRRAQQWLGEPLDVIAIHLDYDDRAGSPYYEVKLLCNEEDLAGAPLAVRRVAQAGDH